MHHRIRAACCLLALLPVSAPAATVTTNTFQGITHYERTETVPRQLVIHVVEIDLTTAGLSFFTTPGNGDLPGETTGQTTSQFATQYGMQIAINSGFFATAQAGTAYRNLSHIAVSDGVGVSPWSGGGSTTEGAMNISQANVATVIRPFSVNVSDYNSRPTGVSLYTTVGGNERILSAGTVIANDNVLHPRTAIGMKGSKLYLLTVDGRQTGWSLGMTTVEVANLLKNDYGVTDAVNLDGGGSTTLVMQQPVVRTINRPSDGVQRTNGNNLGVRATPWPQWWVDAGGNWNTAGNWTGGVPNGVGAVARLMGVATANRTVTANVPVTVGTIQFAGNRSYTVGGSNVVTLDVAAGSAAINAQSAAAATHTIAAPLKLNDAVAVNADAGAAVVLSGALNNSAARAITKTGVGTLTISGAQTHAAGAVLTTEGGATHLNTNAGSAAAPNLTINANAATTFNATQHLTALNVGAGAVVTMPAAAARTLFTRGLSLHATARLDMTSNGLLLDYTGASSEAAVRAAVVNGRNTGFGIVTTPAPAADTVLAVADNAAWGRSSFNGIAIDATTVVGKYTYFGDANLDGKVTGDDYVSVDSNLGTGDAWLEGDFNMSGVTTSDDYVAIDANLGKGTTNPLAFAELKEEMVALHVAMFGDEYLAELAAAEASGFTIVPEPAAPLTMLLMLGMLHSLRNARHASRNFPLVGRPLGARGRV